MNECIFHKFNDFAGKHWFAFSCIIAKLQKPCFAKTRFQLERAFVLKRHGLNV